MRRPRLLFMVLVVPVVVMALLVLVTRQDEEGIDEAEPTSEAEVEAAIPPTSPPAAPEPTAEESTEEAEVEPAPTEMPATAPTDMEEYTSVTEFFTVKVPAGWSSEETFPGGALVMANSTAALERFNNESAIASGDFVLNVGFLPFELFRQREVVPLDIQFEATPDVFLGSLLPMFRVADNAILGDPELVSLSDEREAGLLTVTDEGREGLILMFAAGEEVVAFVSTVGFPGEMAEFQELTYVVANKVAFSGAHDALYGTLLGG